MAELAYKTQINAEKKKKAKGFLQELPPYCATYFSGISGKSGGTILTYIRCIYSFYSYLAEVNSEFRRKGMRNIELEDIALLKRADIYEFLNSLYVKSSDELEVSLEKSTKRIYLSALNSFFSFWEDEEELPYNVISKVDRSQFATRKRHKVIRLDAEEEEGMMNAILYGQGLTKKQQQSSEKTKSRDYAICLTLIRTGIRVSELVGLDIGDINFTKKCFSVARKKSTKKDDVVFFDDDVDQALQEYLGDRARPFSVPSNTPVFQVSQGKYKGNRLSVRSVETIVSKYSAAGAGKKIYPHKLRSSFASNMIAETGNIDLVKEQLGHMNIQTTTLYIDDAVLEKEKARNILKNKRDQQYAEESLPE